MANTRTATFRTPDVAEDSFVDEHGDVQDSDEKVAKWLIESPALVNDARVQADVPERRESYGSCKNHRDGYQASAHAVDVNQECFTTEIEPARLIGDVACLMHLLKGMIGTGILAMPVAYKNGGLWVSLAVVMAIGVICTHCMHILVRCSNHLCARTGDSHLDYAAAMEKAFLVGGARWQKHSRKAKNSVNLFLIFTQFGFCCVYNLFIAQNLQQFFEAIQPHKLDGHLYIVFVSVVIVPYVMIKSLRVLAPFSTVANVFNCVGLVIVFYGLFQDLPNVNTRPAFSSVATLPLFFGQAMFSFEGIGLILPLYNKMEDKARFLGKAGVVNLGLTISICLYCAMGFYGYLKYGTDVMGSVTLNLDSGDWLFQVVKVMFAVSLFISYGVMFYVPVNIIWSFIVRKAAARNVALPWASEYIFRLILVCCICGLAALVPHLDLLISLVGAFASSFLALIFPAIIELVTFQLTWYNKVKDVIIILIGVVGFATGTYSSLKEIVDKF